MDRKWTYRGEKASKLTVTSIRNIIRPTNARVLVILFERKWLWSSPFKVCYHVIYYHRPNVWGTLGSQPGKCEILDLLRFHVHFLSPESHIIPWRINASFFPSSIKFEINDVQSWNSPLQIEGAKHNLNSPCIPFYCTLRMVSTGKKPNKVVGAI